MGTAFVVPIVLIGDALNAEFLRIVLQRCRGGFLAAAGFSLVINLLILTTSVYMMQVYDRVLTSQNLSTLAYLTLIAMGALVAMAALDVVRSRILVNIGVWVDQVLSGKVFGKGLENAVRGERYSSEALRDLATLRTFLSGGGILALFDAPWIPVYLAILYALHPMLGHVSLAGALALLGVAVATELSTRNHLARASAALGLGYQSAEAAVRNAEVIDGMGMLDAVSARWNEINNKVLANQAIASNRAGLVSALAKFLRMALQIAILGVGATLVIKHELGAGAMIGASIIMSRGLAPVEQAIGLWKSMIATRESWRRLSTLLGQDPLHGQSMALPRPLGHLTVEGVVYTPPGAPHPVLNGFNLDIAAGTTLALIGPSAAGKSTLARLMVGIGKPQNGAIRLDGADVAAWDRSSFGRWVGYLPQDVELFPGTIRENIARMTEGDAEAVIEAAKLAGVHDMVLRLPHGYDTVLSDRGGVLSGGQRQRIGLARALYGRPVLLVLDEPNASLDAEGEEALMAAIVTMKAMGTTIVLIAHKPSLTMHADRIAVINLGQVLMCGERTSVLNRLQGVNPREVIGAGTPSN